ncbi:MAG TPA: DUF5655 domain-containing protein [Anaerolineae bacterium]|nr:DUF5655 domain-containing protein [Anaerolineae bacterium]
MNTPDEFFGDQALSKELFATIRRELELLGEVTIRVSKSQIAFRRRRTFASVWMPGRYLKGKTAPLVLTVFLPWRDGSCRWKEIVEPSPGRFTHHLELYDGADVDDQIRDWLRRAWKAAA